MSRIGKMAIALPKEVKVALQAGFILVEGPKGRLKRELRSEIEVLIQDGKILVNRKDDSNLSRGLHGLTRTLISNMVTGVTKGFHKELEINGVGYRAEVVGKAVDLALGFSHKVHFPLPAGIEAKVDAKKTKLSLSGADKEVLGDVAARIRSLRPPEPYKGKGIKYEGEVIHRKEGKSAGK